MGHAFLSATTPSDSRTLQVAADSDDGQLLTSVLSSEGFLGSPICLSPSFSDQRFFSSRQRRTHRTRDQVLQLSRCILLLSLWTVSLKLHDIKTSCAARHQWKVLGADRVSFLGGFRTL